VDGEYNGKKNTLRANREDNTTNHHDQEIIFIVQSPLIMEVKELISD
jgi:hypothetical protein